MSAVGFAFGSGLLVLGVGVTGLMVVFLWPVNDALDRLRAAPGSCRLRLQMERLDALSEVYARLNASGFRVVGIASERTDETAYEVTLDLVSPRGVRVTEVAAELGRTRGIGGVAVDPAAA
jgi:uncharacterized membrane protein YhiD involved in acid resistance